LAFELWALKLPSALALALFVLRVLFADHKNNALSLNDLAVFADFFY